MNYSIKAKVIIEKEFQSRKDKAGIAYLHHLYHVANKIKEAYPHDEELYVIALLHDLLEDIESWNEERLLRYFSLRIVNAVVILTKKKNEKYKDYIQRVKTNKDAKKVKIEDLIHNMNLSRINKVTDNDLKRLVKYYSAFLDLNERTF